MGVSLKRLRRTPPTGGEVIKVGLENSKIRVFWNTITPKQRSSLYFYKLLVRQEIAREQADDDGRHNGRSERRRRQEREHEEEQKNCLNLKSKRKCLDPKQPQEQQTAAAQFSSPITRRQSDAGRGSRRVR